MLLRACVLKTIVVGLKYFFWHFSTTITFHSFFLHILYGIIFRIMFESDSKRISLFFFTTIKLPLSTSLPVKFLSRWSANKASISLHSMLVIDSRTHLRMPVIAPSNYAFSLGSRWQILVSVTAMIVALSMRCNAMEVIKKPKLV